MLKTRLLRQLLSFVLLLLALPAWASPAFVNSQQKTGGTTGSNGLILATTAGNSILVFVGFDNNQANAPHVTGVTDSQGNTYAQLGVIQPNNVTCNGTGGSTACVFMEVWDTLSAASTSSNTITVASAPTGAGTAPAISALQYSGVGTINLTNVATGSGTSATSGTLTITTSQGEDFIVGSFADNPTNTLSVNGCTARGTATGNSTNTVNLKSCDSGAVTNSGTATSLGMTFSSATWAGAAVELCSSSPCPAAGIANHVVIIN